MFKHNIRYTLVLLLMFVTTHSHASVPNAPGAYISVSKLGNSTNAVRIASQDNANDENGFIVSVYDYGTSALVDTIQVDASSDNYMYANISGLTCDKLYKTAVVAYNDDGNSTQSDMRVFNIHTTLGVECPLEAVNIIDYGAIPDDGLDDTQAIMSALSVSGSITMPTGTYDVKELTRLGDKTIIDGNGSTFISELVIDDDGEGRTSRNILTLQGNQIEIKNLLLDGAYTNGQAKPRTNISSLLHIYDSTDVLLDGVDTINHASNFGSGFNYSMLNNDHTKDMEHVVFIAFSTNVTINDMEQKGNMGKEGLLIYDSDNITINNFNSHNSPSRHFATSLHILASDNITMTDVNVSDGALNADGSSINFIANHNFTLTNVTTMNKQGFDMSNEISNLPEGFTGRITRDTSFGTFNNCRFEGERGLYAEPVINKNENIVFNNTTFIPTNTGAKSFGAQILKGKNIEFDNCTFGSNGIRNYGLRIGSSESVTVSNSTFINPSTAIYIAGANVGDIKLLDNTFNGNNYSPVGFYWADRYSPNSSIVNNFTKINNQTLGTVLNNEFYYIDGPVTITSIVNN